VCNASSNQLEKELNLGLEKSRISKDIPQLPTAGGDGGGKLRDVQLPGIHGMPISQSSPATFPNGIISEQYLFILIGFPQRLVSGLNYLNADLFMLLALFTELKTVQN
jgi:hypothetical protein